MLAHKGLDSTVWLFWCDWVYSHKQHSVVIQDSSQWSALQYQWSNAIINLINTETLSAFLQTMDGWSRSIMKSVFLISLFIRSGDHLWGEEGVYRIWEVLQDVWIQRGEMKQGETLEVIQISNTMHGLFKDKEQTHANPECPSKMTPVVCYSWTWPSICSCAHWQAQELLSSPWWGSLFSYLMRMATNWQWLVWPQICGSTL